MAKKVKDITKTGALSYRDLQEQNALNPATNVTAADLARFMQDNKILGSQAMTNMVYDQNARVDDYLESSSLAGQNTRLGNPDYWGNSIFDPDIVVGEQDWNNLSDVRAENQPWYSKLTNGVGKAGVLAVTTALETAGLLYGAGHSLLESVGAIEDNKKSWLQDLWNNPITNALQKVTEASEEYMPNYYTQDEQENPWGHIFSSNFLGDKLIKNLGFMVGAFYGGMPAVAGIGKLGTMGVKAARTAATARAGGMARRFGELTAGYSDDVLGKVGQYGREIAGLSDDAAASIGARYGEDVTGLYRKLAQEGLTESERGKKILEGLDKINSIANTTRAATQTVGVIGSAINEGAIEALNNSKDWADMRIREENDSYQQSLAEIEAKYGGMDTFDAIEEKMALAQDHEKKLAAIEKGRAEVGNADLLMNLPILIASNAYQLGRLYTRGFNSTRREMGSLWNGHKLSGSLERGTLATDKSTWKGVLSALSKSNTEGVEEITQRMAADAAGNAVDNAIARYMSAGNSEEAKTNTDDYIAGMGKAIADNLQDPKAWEEYMIGAVSSMVGMPVFGSQTKNAYLGKGKAVGLQGGFFGNLNEYKDAMKKEHDVAEYLNKRVKNPEFKAYYDSLKKHFDYDKWMEEATQDENGKLTFKDLDLENFYQDINAAASSGHLEEFKQLVGYNQDYTDEELEDIVKQTRREVTPEQQRKADEDRKNYLTGQIAELSKLERALTPDESKLYDELAEINKRLEANDYKTKYEGPFIDRNGAMNVTDPAKMRQILERNRQNLLQGIDDYLKIRNDIDIETDGKLDDQQIATLTMMRGHIIDYEKRSADMTEDLVNSLMPSQGFLDMLDKTESKKLEAAQKELETAQEELKNAKEEDKKAKEEAVAAAMKKVLLAGRAVQSNKTILKLLEPVEASRLEQRALNRGYGKNENGRTYTDEYGNERSINMEEAQAVFANPLNAARLKAFVNALGLDRTTANKLVGEIDDMHKIAAMKKEYTKRVREYMNDPTLINEAFQRVEDSIKTKDIDNKAGELSLRIQGVNNMTELDQLLRENSVNGERVVQAALQKAKQEGNEDVKNLISDFENGHQFFNAFQEQVSRLSPDLNGMLSQAAITSWEEALADNLNVYDKFIEHMNESADLLEEAGNKRAANALRKVLNDLNSTKKESSTNKHVAEPSKTDSKPDEKSSKKEGKKSGLAAFTATSKKEREKDEAEKKETKPAAPKTPQIDYDTLKKDIIAELRDSNSTKDSIASLSKPLRDSIDEWHADPSHEKITDINLRQWIQEIQDGKWEDKAFEREVEEADADYEEWKENRGEEMSMDTKGNFKSGYQSEFRMEKVGGRYIEYAVPYPGEDAQHQKAREILKNFLAYDFVDHNWLGYAMKAYEDEEIPVYFMQSTEHGINQPNRPVTFLAIELTPAVKRSIQKWAYNEQKGKGKADISEGIHPVEINGKQYQIIGVLSINAEENVSPEVKDAFDDLQQQLHDNLHTKLADEKKKAKEEGREPVPFIMDDTLSSKITKIFTGRLEKYNDADDNGENVSLFTFMTSQQGGREDRKTSLEWKNGVPFRFGVVVNKDIKVPPIGEDEVIETPSGEWCQKKGNNGAILLFVPKADGHLYPLRCTRRSVGTWLEDTNDIDGTHQDGRALLENLLNPESPVKNAYLDRIIELIKILTDDSDTYSFGQKLDAKYRLASFFTFGRKNPIQLDASTMEVSLQLEGEEPVMLNGETLHDNVMAFFDAIKGVDRIRFTLPAPATSNSSDSSPDSNMSSRDVIMSGVFEIGLRGFYNFNANVIVEPINGKGEVVKVKTAPENDGYAPNEYAGDDRSYTINGEKKDYHISYEEGVAKVTYQDGTIPSDDEQNIVITLEGLSDENHKETVIRLVENIKQDLGVRWNKAQIQLLTDALSESTSGLYSIYTSDGLVIYDSKAQELFTLSSKKGQDLLNELKGKIMSFVQHNTKAIMDAAKKADKDSADDNDVGNTTGSTILMNTIPTTLSGFISEAKAVYPDVNWNEISSRISKIETASVDLALDQINTILSEYLTNEQIVNLRTDAVHYSWALETARLVAKQTLNSSFNKPSSPAGNDAESKGNLFKGATLDSIKSEKEKDTLLGIIANAYDNKQLKGRAKTIFDTLKSVDENFVINMPEDKVKARVKDLLGMKKGWKDKLKALVDDLTKCP